MSTLPRWLPALTRMFGWRSDGPTASDLARRISERARQRGLEAGELVGRAEMGNLAARELLAELGAVSETYFFREIGPLEAAVDAALAGLREGRTFRAWCAACATGEEAYTVAALLTERLGAGRFRVVGSDIDLPALAKARTGRYGPWSLRGRDAERTRRFLSGSGESFEVPGPVKSAVDFFSWNLTDAALPAFAMPGAFDLVICRNALAYMAKDSSAAIVKSLARAVAPTGALLIGPLDIGSAPEGLTALRGMEGLFTRSAPLPPAARAVFAPVAALRRALATPPPAAPDRNLELRLQQALSLLDRGLSEEARRAFADTLLLDATLPLAELGIALSFDALGQPEEARAHAQKALALTARLPDSASVVGGGTRLSAGAVRSLAADVAREIR